MSHMYRTLVNSKVINNYECEGRITGSKNTYMKTLYVFQYIFHGLTDLLTL